MNRTVMIIAAVGAVVLALFLWPSNAKAATRKAGPPLLPGGQPPTISPTGAPPPPHPGDAMPPPSEPVYSPEVAVIVEAAERASYQGAGSF